MHILPYVLSHITKITLCNKVVDSEGTVAATGQQSRSCRWRIQTVLSLDSNIKQKYISFKSLLVFYGKNKLELELDPFLIKFPQPGLVNSFFK